MPVLSSVNDLDLMGRRLGAVVSSLGEVEIMGADIASLLESLGAADKAANVHHALERMRQAKAVDPHSVQVIQMAYKSVANLPTPIPPTLILAASPRATIEVKTSRPTKPQEFEVPSFISPFFRITSANIRGVEQLNAPDLEAETYSTGALGRSKINWLTINTSTPLILTVVMTDVTKDRTFSGTVHGPTLLA